VTLAPNTRGGMQAHLHVASNAPGRFSVLPYSARTAPGFPLALPVAWTAFGAFAPDSVAAGGLEAYLAANGEAFAGEVAAIGAQSFGDRGGGVCVAGCGVALPVAPVVHGSLLPAALAVLQDGVARTAQQIFDLAKARGLVADGASAKYVYTALIEYIARANGNGRRPAIVQNGDRTFRINEPPDGWPAVALPADPAPSAQAVAAADALESSARSGDGAAFERAVCDAFAALGFAAVHLGGQKAPDGYADAQLGPLGYRVMLE
jgi:hypothetical protein